MVDLIILLEAGVPLTLAIGTVLEGKKNGSSFHRMNEMIQRGIPLPQACGVLFPWWCPNPFYFLDAPVDTRSFLHACHCVIESRKSRLKRGANQLAYPTLLFFISLGMGTMFINSAAAVQIHDSLASSRIIFWCLFFIVGLGLIGLTRSMVAISSIDILEICMLLMKQGYPLGDIFDRVSIKGVSQKKWKKTMDDTVQIQSFIQAFSIWFKLPKAIQVSLEMQEKSGCLMNGIEQAIPYLKTTHDTLFKYKCFVIKLVLYGIVTGILLLMLYGIYSPALTIDVG